MDYVIGNQLQPGSFPPIDFRSELNDEQFAAVTAEPGPLLILAGAGSGKTRTLTYRVAYLLSKGVDPSEILLLTFTNKAAKEMLQRVEDLTGAEGNRFWGGTFHHIGHRLLRSHGNAIDLNRSFTILDAGEAESFLKDTVEELDTVFFKDKANPRPKPLSSVISMARNTCLSLEETVVTHFPQYDRVIPRLDEFAALYAKRKRKHQVVDYDDLLEYWLRLIEEAPEIIARYQNRFKHTLVDEYQDTNTLQAKIVDGMASNHQIMAVGDDAQCIYSWRGANFENILTFPDRHPGTTIHRIETNYRSSPEILYLANNILQNQTEGKGFEKELRASRPSNTIPYLIPSIDTREQARFIISRLQGLTDEGRSPNDIAILYRAHFQALDLQIELSKANIPYRITSGVRFFEQAHVRDIVAHLRFVYNPTDIMAFHRLAILLPKIGDKSARKLYNLAFSLAESEQHSLVDAMLQKDIIKKVPKAAKDDWISLMETIQDMQASIPNQPPDEIVQLAIEGWYGLYLQGAYANYMSRLDDLKSLVGFAGRYDDMQDMLAQIILLNSEISDRSVDDQEPTIRLTTVHQAKGLEFDIVSIIGLADGLFPLRRTIEEGDIEEERRLFYVAVTRARDELYLLYPRVNTKGGPVMSLSPSRFIQELPTDAYETVRIRRSYGW
ncbi:MAG: ATP-dependent helicase [Opitutaceae bacterium]|nr:ATP-dependent helicase [Opitutaceae bacterium]